jgi:uncharacterized protein YpbB
VINIIIIIKKNNNLKKCKKNIKENTDQADKLNKLLKKILKNKNNKAPNLLSYNLSSRLKTMLIILNQFNHTLSHFYIS